MIISIGDSLSDMSNSNDGEDREDGMMKIQRRAS
jgi:hypothetical protein